MSISIQLGTKGVRRFTHKTNLQEDLSKFPKMSIFFGIGQMQEQNTEFFPVQSPSLFLRILELASFDGNIIDFDITNTKKSVKQILNTKRILSGLPQGYSDNMDLIHYQLYCGDRMFLNRLKQYTSSLEVEAIENNWIEKEDFVNLAFVDFVGCDSIPSQTNVQGCLWGRLDICFVCDSDYYLSNFECVKCQKDLNINLFNNNQYLDLCTSQPIQSVPYVNVDLLDSTSQINNGLYFISTDSSYMQTHLVSLLTKYNIQFVTDRIKNTFSSSLKNNKSTVTTYVMDFMETALEISDFPLDLQIMQASLYMDSDQQLSLAWKNVFAETNTWPFVQFTIRKT